MLWRVRSKSFNQFYELSLQEAEHWLLADLDQLIELRLADGILHLVCNLILVLRERIWGILNKLLHRLVQFVNVLAENLQQNDLEIGSSDLMVDGFLIFQILDESSLSCDRLLILTLSKLELVISVYDVAVEEIIITLEDLLKQETVKF